MAGAVGSLPIDLLESDHEFVIRASLPGARPEDVQITVHGDTLTIRGETHPEDPEPGQEWLLRERRSGAYQRSFALGRARGFRQGGGKVRQWRAHLEAT